MADDHVDVSISDGMFTIRGEKRSESEKKNKEGRLIRSERSYGAFERSFPLPADADEDKISAPLPANGRGEAL